METEMQINITAQTFTGKYTHGLVIHTASQADKAVPDQNPKEVARRNAIRDVCLNCTKERCTGAEECYRAEKRRRQND